LNEDAVMGLNFTRMNEARRTTIATSAFQERLDLLGVRAQASSPAEMDDFVASEIKRRTSVIENAGVQRIGKSAIIIRSSNVRR
jgi:tripartite-type tricarboxylate transporter receptor subunit TctC